jgi:hypothetical protein
MTSLPVYERPKEIELCYQAVCDVNFEEVKKQVQQLLHDPRPVSQPEPHPAWLYNSLTKAIENQNIEIV